MNPEPTVIPGITDGFASDRPVPVEDSPYQRAILRALNTTGKHVYAGTETPEERVSRRRTDRRRAALSLPAGRARLRALTQADKATDRGMRRAARPASSFALVQEVPR